MLPDEFSLLHENAAEIGLPFDRRPAVERISIVLSDGRRSSAIRWGTGNPEIVLLHGGGQNAHTWDSVALALGGNLIAIDLPGHGHSDGASDREGGFPIDAYADDVAEMLSIAAPRASYAVGMSAGGLTAITLCARHPERFARLMLVDILPDPDPAAAGAISNFLDGPPTFATFEEMADRAIAHNPRRSPSSLRRGVFHNAVQGEDGRWRWRHQRHRRALAAMRPEERAQRYERLWAMLAALSMPVMLARGGAPGSVVTNAQEERLRAMLPAAIVLRIEEAGHSIQGDAPVRLAQAIAEFGKCAISDILKPEC